MEPLYYTKDKEEKEELTPLLLSDLLEEPELNRPILNFPYLRGGTINIGSENKVFKFEQDKGLWLGNQDFNSAPFRVDMTGKVTATGVNIQGQLNAGTGSAIDWSYIQNVQVQNAQIANLAVNDAKISNVSASKLTAGTIDANIINVINLNASNITTGTLTGRTVQTASSGRRVVIDGTNNLIEFFDSGGVSRGTIYGIPTGIGFTGNIDAGSVNITAYRLYLNAGAGAGIQPTWNGSIDLGSSSYKFRNLYLSNNIYIDNDVYPNSSNADSSLGFPTRYFLQLYSHFVRYKDLAAFQHHDDIALIKKIKTKRIRRVEPYKLNSKNQKISSGEREIEVWDETTMPSEVFNEGFYDAGAVNGLLLGTLKQVIERLENLEQKVLV